MTSTEAITFFEKHGSFCRTGNGTTFAIEAFHRDKTQLSELKDLWGGNVYKPPPAAPTRWTWRLYGAPARALWTELRPHMTEAKQVRGDRKLEHCSRPFNVAIS